jgi:hypothetical protein
LQSTVLVNSRYGSKGRGVRPWKHTCGTGRKDRVEKAGKVNGMEEEAGLIWQQDGKNESNMRQRYGRMGRDGNPLKPSGNYLNHQLLHSGTPHFVFMDLVRFLAKKQRLFP